MSFSPGSLVRARRREWVVMPESEGERLVLRPLGGRDDEVVAIYTPIEEVESAKFQPPDPGKDLGNRAASKLLTGALRLGFRAAAGPFRCLARIAVEPRPYQLVPLMMALQLDPVRLLIADDVGIGKTIESLLIARELLDRGEIRSLCVLCPPHLAEQWQRAMSSLFHLDAVLVLAGTAGRLERELPPGESIFEHYPITVVSVDFIKSEKRQLELLRCCPDFVIVDEAHTCTSGAGKGQQRRHALLQKITAVEPARHLVLVTATPHSGKDDTFRSLLGLLDEVFLGYPTDLSGEDQRKRRERLARHLVQRRRGDLDNFLGTETPFPDREATEAHYKLSEPYLKFFDRVLKYCREQVRDSESNKHHQRVRWWAALALLRALASSPAAAAQTLRNRAAPADTETVEDADEVGRRTVMDVEEETGDDIDVAPGAQVEDEQNHRKRLLAMAREAEDLSSHDNKLKQVTKLVRKLLAEGYSPILFCRFISTAKYVEKTLSKRLGKKVTVEAVTGELPPDEREARVERLSESEQRVLVCTDCLSEGINLQDWFDAVLHYDLSWNPTRHEQREGRVDRYGQPKPKVRVVTFYGKNNPIDGIVLQVLLRKHRAIRSQLGINVPVPMDANAVTEAIFEGLLFREDSAVDQVSFAFAEPKRQEVDVAWSKAADREKRSRTIYAQHSIKVEDLSQELLEVRRAIGNRHDVESFVEKATLALGGDYVRKERTAKLLLQGANQALRDAMGLGEVTTAKVVFEPPAPRGTELLTRTHPWVAGLASYVFQGALDPTLADSDKYLANAARRCSVTSTSAVATRTTVLLLRLRFHLIDRQRDGTTRPLLAEDLAVVGFEGLPKRAAWLAPERAWELAHAPATARLAEDVARHHVERMLNGLPRIEEALQEAAQKAGEALLDAHRRVRKADRRRGINRGLRNLDVETHRPDVLGLFVLIPDGRGGVA